VNYRQSLSLSEQIGDQIGVVTTYYRLGVLAEQQERFEQAESFYRQSAAIAERIGEQTLASLNYHRLRELAKKR
jgi:hypothetical protein